MEASLTCAVCLSLFEEPVTLPLCSHNFCRGCLVECLSLARSASEESPPPSPPRTASRARNYDSWHQVASARAPRPSGGGLATVSVSCPLCRKACPLPRDLGAAALPVNTTLAEVVKLFKASHRRLGEGEGAQVEEAEDTASSALAPQLAALGERCPKHPGRALQLYCRLCCQGGCSQCVSEDHRGIFHAVNLIDTVYQEEKLAFFSNLKKLRTVHLKLTKEITTHPNDSGALMQNEEEHIKGEFEKICNALQTRKKQLLEDLESQKEKKEKESQIWKRMKEVHRKTIEKVLNDCENLVNECDPQRFLEVACSLNQRMKTQLDLMEMASNHENQLECKQMKMDTTSVVNDILALKLTAVDLGAVKGVTSGKSEHLVFANTEKKWDNLKCVQNIFHPMTREDTILDNGSNTSTRSLLATAESESLSYEEARYNYLASRTYSDELQTQVSAPNTKTTLPKPLPSSITTLEIPLPFLNAEANNQKELKIPVEQKEVSESSFSNSIGFTFSAPAGKLNFSVSNNIFNIQKSQKDSKKTLFSGKGSILKPATIPPPRSLALPFGTQPPFTGASNSPPSTPSSAVSINFNSLGDVRHPAPPLLFSSSGSLTSYTATTGLAPSFKTNNPCFTLFLGKTESLDCALNSINGCNASTVVSSTTTMSFPPVSPIVGPGLGSARENSCFPVLPTSSQNAPFQTAILSSSQQAFFPTMPKTVEENKATSFTKDHNLGAGWYTPPAVSKQAGGISCCSANAACSSASCVFEKADASSKQPVPGNLSPGSSWTSNAPFLFTFKGNLNNRCAPLTSSMGSFNKTKQEQEGNVDPPKSSIPLKNNIPFYQESKDLTSSSSFFSMNKSQKSETENTVSSQSVAHDVTANLTLVSPNLPAESRFPLEDSANTEDHIRFPSLTNRGVSNVDSDVEDLSQASNSTDSSCTSEYFSVAEDKVLPS